MDVFVRQSEEESVSLAEVSVAPSAVADDNPLAIEDAILDAALITPPSPVVAATAERRPLASFALVKASTSGPDTIAPDVEMSVSNDAIAVKVAVIPVLK